MAERGLLVHKGCWKKRGNALFLQPDLDLWDGNFYMAKRVLTCTQGLMNKKRVNATYFVLNLYQNLELWGAEFYSACAGAELGLTGTQGLLDKKG
jgi:hypothetical protein